MKDELEALEARNAELLQETTVAPPPAPRLHPNLAELYRRKVASLSEALNAEGTRLEAAGLLQELIDEVRLIPENGKLAIELHGDLAMMLRAGIGGSGNRAGGKSGADASGLASATLVAGIGFEPMTFRL